MRGRHAGRLSSAGLAKPHHSEHGSHPYPPLPVGDGDVRRDLVSGVEQSVQTERPRGVTQATSVLGRWVLTCGALVLQAHAYDKQALSQQRRGDRCPKP